MNKVALTRGQLVSAWLGGAGGMFLSMVVVTLLGLVGSISAPMAAAFTMAITGAMAVLGARRPIGRAFTSEELIRLERAEDLAAMQMAPLERIAKRLREQGYSDKAIATTVGREERQIQLQLIEKIRVIGGDAGYPEVTDALGEEAKALSIAAPDPPDDNDEGDPPPS